jgi:hypothetical protein
MTAPRLALTVAAICFGGTAADVAGLGHGLAVVALVLVVAGAPVLVVGLLRFGIDQWHAHHRDAHLFAPARQLVGQR